MGIISFPICEICLEKIEFMPKIDESLSLEEKEREFKEMSKTVLTNHKVIIHKVSAK